MKFALILTSLSLTTSTALADGFPVTVTDDRPATVTIQSVPERIITLANFATDMAAALDIETLGVTTYEGARPLYLGEAASVGSDMGDLTAPNLELMATLDPDLTIGMLRYNGPFEEEITAMGDFLAYSSNTIDDSVRIVGYLGKALGRADDAHAMNEQYLAALDEIAAAAPNDKPSYLFIWNFQDMMYAYQDNLLPSEVFTRIGAVNAAGRSNAADEGNAFMVLDPEQLLELDPEVIFMFTSHAGPVKHSPLLERLQAVQNGRAWSMGYQYSQSSGPIAREMVLREAAHLLWPDSFPEPQMPEGARAVALTFAQ